MGKIGTVPHGSKSASVYFNPAMPSGMSGDKAGIKLAGKTYYVGFVDTSVAAGPNSFKIDGVGTFKVDQAASSGVLATSTRWGLKIVAAPAASDPGDPVEAGAGRPGIATTIPVGTMKEVAADWQPKSGEHYQNLIIKGQKGFDGISNAVFTGCVFDAKGARWCCRMDRAGTGNIFNGCEFKNMASSAIWGRNYQAIGCYVHDSKGDGFKVGTGGNVLIARCYVERLGMSDGAHADGVQIRGGGNVKILGNFFNMPTNVPGTSTNASVFIQAEGTVQAHDITVDGNWCLGGNYTIAAYATKDIRITGNTFYAGTPRYGFGNVFDGVVWSGNVTADGKAATPQMK